MAFPLIAAALGLAECAPLIARWLGGPQAADVATQVVERARRISGVDDPIEARKILMENAVLLLEFQKSILQLETELEQSFLKDRQNARFRDVALATTGKTNTRADIMVLAAAAGLVLCLCSLAYYSSELPGEAVGIISPIAGIFGACLKDAYAFEFGSSRGNKEKDTTVAAIIERNGL